MRTLGLVRSGAAKREALRRMASTVVLVVVVSGASSSQADGPDPVAAKDERDRGFYLGLGAAGTSYTVDLDDRATPTVEGFRFDERGGGLEIFCGWAFDPRFRLEFGANVTLHDARPSDAGVAVTGARISGCMPLVTGRRFEPSILAGMGVSGVAFAGDDLEDRFYVAMRGDLGAGLRIRMTRHQFLQGRFLYSLHDVEFELIDRDGDVDSRHVGGTAWTRTISLGWGWDF